MKLIISTLLLSSALMAQTLHYKVKAPIFGKIGDVTINYSSGSTYSIDAHVTTSGFAKKLSGNRVERYHSEGMVVNNIYKAKHFKQNFTYKNKRGLLKYDFDYASRVIMKTRKKWVGSNLVYEKIRPLEFFTHNDLFSVYHNIVVQLRDKPSGIYTLKAAGMEKVGGNLTIKIPPKSVQRKEAKSLGLSGNLWVFHIITHRKIMKSSNGEIIFAVGSDGIARGVRVLNTAYVSHIDAILD